jgi:hypothetical protein
MLLVPIPSACRLISQKAIGAVGGVNMGTFTTFTRSLRIPLVSHQPLSPKSTQSVLMCSTVLEPAQQRPVEYGHD